MPSAASGSASAPLSTPSSALPAYWSPTIADPDRYAAGLSPSLRKPGSKSLQAVTTDAQHPAISDLDACALPKASLFPAPTVVKNYVGQPYSQPNLAIWYELSMDAWIDELVAGCPIINNVWLDVNEVATLPQTLGRLSIGYDTVQKTYASPVRSTRP